MGNKNRTNLIFNKRSAIMVGGGILALLLGGEIILRGVWGLANAPLYQESSEWEYMACPNQDGFRFGNHYHWNSYQQRSEEPDTTKNIVLGLGDSVLFGGILTDQDSTSSYVFNRLRPDCQMLNISAGSWGPDNCAAYLKHYGTFGAKAMVLLVSSHDAHDNMNFLPVVGKHVSYPNKQYWSAWAELICRYVWPRTIGKLVASKGKDDPDAVVVKSIDGTDIMKGGKAFNPGFGQLKEIADSCHIRFVVLLHPDIKEVEAEDYNEQGKEIIEWCEANDVPLVLELKEGIKKEMYRDGIHTNKQGQRFQAELMSKYLRL